MWRRAARSPHAFRWVAELRFILVHWPCAAKVDEIENEPVKETFSWKYL